MLVGIFGAGRNGSTLLMRLLDGSPGLWVYPIELNYLTNFTSGSWKGRLKRLVEGCVPVLPGAIASSWDSRYRRIFHNWAAGQLGELKQTYLDKLQDPLMVKGDPFGAIKQRTGRSLATDLEDFLHILQSCYDDRVACCNPLLVFKSIEVPNLDRYREMFPTMKFVHIVRHPYSNYSSLKRTDMVLKQKPFWFQGGDILRLQLEERWIPHARFVLRGLKDERGRHLLVRYEDLCESPERVVADICQRLSVPPPEHASVQTVLGGKRIEELPINSSKQGVKTPTRVISDMAKEFGYDDILTDRERGLILLRTYYLARQLGYFTSVHEATLPNKLELFRQWMAPDQWEYMNARPKLRLVRALVERRLYLCKKLLLSSA